MCLTLSGPSGRSSSRKVQACRTARSKISRGSSRTGIAEVAVVAEIVDGEEDAVDDNRESLGSPGKWTSATSRGMSDGFMIR